jgi:hypothetical protein
MDGTNGIVGTLALAALVAAAAPAGGREIEDILHDKGILTDTEATEAKAAREKTPAAAGPALPEWIAKTKFSGDLRVRNESFFLEGTPDRVRQRFRLRFGAKVDPTSETEVGFQLATGTPGDPISNNQSFDDTFTFKNIDLTNAYLKIRPSGTFGWPRPYVTLWGGKFLTPTWHPTRLQFDGDLAPEGFFETFQPVAAETGTLRGLQLNLGQWVFEEVSSRGDGALFAFQGVGTFQLGPAVSATLGLGDFLYQKPSLIAAKRNSNPELAITNRVRLSDGRVVGGRRIDPAKEKDAEGNPVRLFGGYVKNTEARGDDTGFQLGFGIGPAKDPGDANLVYAYQRLETDAVVSTFTDSDFGRDGGTNSKGHILQLNVLPPLRGLQFTSTTFFVEPVRNVAGRSPKTEVRWQVDVVAKF